jgi:hypothetical protein
LEKQEEEERRELNTEGDKWMTLGGVGYESMRFSGDGQRIGIGPSGLTRISRQKRYKNQR